MLSICLLQLSGGSRSQNDLDHAILVVPKLLIQGRRVFEARGMSHYKTGVDFARLNLGEQRLGVSLDGSRLEGQAVADSGAL